MFSWLFVVILSYVFFSLSSFGDKLILAGPVKPKLYIFYVGILGGLVIFLIPFIKFGLPTWLALLWIILEAITFILAVYIMYLALERFEASRVIPVIGALQPILILVLTFIFFGFQSLVFFHFLAFILLLLGSIVISIEKNPQITAHFLFLAFLSALLFSLDYIFSKMVFLNQPFLQGLIWMRIFILLMVLALLISGDFRKQVFAKSNALNKKIGSLILLTQAAGGAGVFLQSFAISLTPAAYLAVINSLRGVQYIFLFLITLFFSIFFPRILREDFSRRVLVRKIAGILIIFLGLAMLVLY